MPEKSIFNQEWRNCLQAHYKTFVRDEYLPQTERKAHARDALERVLNSVGFSDDELHELYIRATMRVEDVPDFVPTFEAHPAECQCAVCNEALLTRGHDDKGQPLPVEPTPEPEPQAAGNIHAVAKRSGMMFDFGDDLDDEPAPLPQEAEAEAGKGKRKGKKTEPAEPKLRRQSMF